LHWELWLRSFHQGKKEIETVKLVVFCATVLAKSFQTTDGAVLKQPAPVPKFELLNLV